MSEWKPGTVAMVTASNRREEYRAYFDGKVWQATEGSFSLVEPLTLRPLVVIDPDPSDSTPESILRYAARLVRRDGVENFGGEVGEPDSDADTLDAWADQIEAQTRPPKPPEPQGLWAVVEGRDGNRWVKEHFGHLGWRHIGGVDRSTSWKGITTAYLPVTVLSEGRP